MRELAAGASRPRGDEDPDIIPAVLPLGGAERGAGAVALRLLRLFRVDPAKELANVVTRKAIAAIEGKLAGAPGVYRLRPDGSLGKALRKPIPPPEKPAPLLVFLHGTASSTMGSFGGL